MRTIHRFALALIVLFPASLWGQFIVRPVNLSYLSRRAGVIVQGRVVKVQYEPMPGYEHIPTVRITLAVTQMLRGPKTRQYTFRQWLPAGRARAGKYGRYRPGSEVVLFLMSPSDWGLSSPIGHEQGTFRVESDAQGNKYIANGYDNAGIFSGVVNEAAQSGVTLSASERQTASKKGPVELDHFLKLVRTLMTQPRIK